MEIRRPRMRPSTDAATVRDREPRMPPWVNAGMERLLRLHQIAVNPPAWEWWRERNADKVAVFEAGLTEKNFDNNAALLCRRPATERRS